MIGKDDVLKIARLADLLVSEEEGEALTADLNAILGYVEKLNEINVSSVEPMSHVHGSVNIFREDKVQPSMDPDEGLKNVPDRSGRFIRVPIIVT